MSRRSPSPGLILAVVAFGVFVAADDLTVVSTMLRQIIFDLEIPLPDGLDKAAWIVNAYLIAYVVVMPFIGRLSDIVGRRAVYVGALALFLIGSIWIPLAPDLPSFIVGRVLTALGGGAMVPVAMAVIGDVYPREKRARALGALGAIDTAGWVWGPLYGALLIRFLTWQWQFYLNIPLSLIGMAAAWWVLRDLPQPQARERVDWWGTAVLTLSLLILNIALLGSGDVQAAGGFANLGSTEPANTGWLYAIAAVSFIAFLLIERRPAAAPLIDLTLFRRRNFSPAIWVNFMVGGVLIIAMVNVPLVINVLEFDVNTAALTSGYLLSGMTGAMALASYVGGRLTERFSYRPVTVLGLTLCALGFALMGGSWVVGTPYREMAGQLVVLGMGFGLVIAPVGTAVINAAPDTQRGIASSLVIVLRLMGMSVGLSALTAWGLHRFAILRTQITLPDLPLSDPVYQQAIIDGLTQVTVKVLTETFLVSAVVMGTAVLISLRLRRER
ncbi:MAG: MFS transporter [Ardenticatenaceae bacterium]|nr:MFS transporter [Anaerolineales bacterium]MCB8920579.1 MFS transporter [Ardenticatenaceae bacterium]MCB8990204.1 MFS transporter [Ardenticatenaceae bacterium]MCB9003005.1 MFS transporter [Ardenticatenaceae bacterium]